ncbi:MAG: hypothetical protein EBZ47_10195, partial [Chlamydiae bacterium]|nr:hypothetical protein [Chlamydiota bacterium]
FFSVRLTECNIMEFDFSTRLNDVVSLKYEFSMQLLGKRFRGNAASVKMQLDRYFSGKQA